MSNTDWKSRDEQDKLTRKSLVTLAPAIAKALGPAWRAEAPKNHDASLDGPLPSWYSLIGPEGEDLFVGVEFDNKAKLAISGQFHDREDGQQFWYLPTGSSRPSIGVSASRGAEVIAAEIRRRLLPDYSVLLASCNAARRKWQARRDSAANIAAELAAYIGAPLVDNVNDRDKTERKVNVYRSESLAGSYIDLKVRGGEQGEPASVRFDHIDVPPTVALAILDVLTRYHVKPGDEEV